MTTSSTMTETQTVPAIELQEIPKRPTGSKCDSINLSRRPEEDSGPEPVESSNRLDNRSLLKVVSAGFSFLVAGFNDGSTGALLPYMIREYNINTAIVSSVYAANVCGWLFAAAANTHLSQYLDLGAMLALGALCQIIAHSLRAWDPPFGLFVATFFMVCVGQAFQDTYGNTYVSTVKNSHRWLGFIHAMYMLGCLIAPFVSTAVASHGVNVDAGVGKSKWYLYYTFPAGMGAINLALVLIAFRDSVGIKKKSDTASSTPTQQHSDEPSQQEENNADASRNKDAMRLIKQTFRTPSVWLLSMFFFFYIGAALTASGWIVEYLVTVRHGDLSQMGYVPAGFNGGCLLSRLFMAEPTHRFGPKKMVFVYCLMALAFQLVFWLVPNIIVAAIAVSLIGFAVGPLFATGISLGSKLFNREIQSTALAFVFVFAQMGGSVFPIITGVIASHAGVAVLQPILTGLLVATGISWLLVPRPKETGNNDLHQE